MLTNNMSLITKKPVFEVCDQVRHKQTCTATEARWRLEISDIETRGIILSRQWTTKVLIKLGRCAGWSVPLIFPYGINRFSHDMAHMFVHATYSCACFSMAGYRRPTFLPFVRLSSQHLGIHQRSKMFFISQIVRATVLSFYTDFSAPLHEP